MSKEGEGREDELQRWHLASTENRVVVANVYKDPWLVERANSEGKAVYIGRPCPAFPDGTFGNPFKIDREAADAEAERSRVIREYEDHLRGNGGLQTEIRTSIPLGSVLLCYCHPLGCHGDVIAKFLNQ